MSFDLGKFSSHSDEEHSTRQSLNWRLDPEHSWSDWTIVVSSQQEHEERTTSYHVHKNIVSVGPRSSQYFARLFRTTMVEANIATSCIELQESAEAAFPDMLDFMYGISQNITTESACALRYLASYFVIEELWTITTEFVMQNLNVQSAPLYFVEASLYQDEKIFEAARAICAQNFEQVDQEMLMNLPPELFRSIVTSSDLQCSSTSLCRVVTPYVRKQPQIESQLFSEITHSSLMTEIDPEYSISLLKLAIERENDDESVRSQQSLRDRCIRCAGRNWEQSIVSKVVASTSNGSESLMNDYNLLPADVKLKMLQFGLVEAFRSITEVRSMNTDIQAQFSALETKYEETRSKHDARAKEVANLREKLARSQRSGISKDKALSEYKPKVALQESHLKELREKVATISESLAAAESNVSSLTSKINQLEGQNRNLAWRNDAAEAELKKFIRVPLTHDFDPCYRTQNISHRSISTTYSRRGYNGDNPEQKPTAMPFSGGGHWVRRGDECGYIYREDISVLGEPKSEINMKGKNWPVFYYREED